MKPVLEIGSKSYPVMPPTRGHDLKQSSSVHIEHPEAMPPTRGHDLKHSSATWGSPVTGMPPTRGHDLKRFG